MAIFAGRDQDRRGCPGGPFLPWRRRSQSPMPPAAIVRRHVARLTSPDRLLHILRFTPGLRLGAL